MLAADSSGLIASLPGSLFTDESQSMTTINTQAETNAETNDIHREHSDSASEFSDPSLHENLNELVAAPGVDVVMSSVDQTNLCPLSISFSEDDCLTRFDVKPSSDPTQENPDPAPQPTGDPASPPEQPISERAASIDPLQPISLLPIAGIGEASTAGRTKTLNDVSQPASLSPHQYFLQSSVEVDLNSANIRTGLIDQFQTVSLIEPEFLTRQTFSAGKSSASSLNDSSDRVASSFLPFAFDTAQNTPTSLSDTLETNDNTSTKRKIAATLLSRESSVAEGLKVKIRPASNSGLELLDAVFALPEELITPRRTTGLKLKGLATELPVSQPAVSKPEDTDKDRSVTPLIECVFLLTIIAGERNKPRESLRLVDRKSPE